MTSCNKGGGIVRRNDETHGSRCVAGLLRGSWSLVTICRPSCLVPSVLDGVLERTGGGGVGEVKGRGATTRSDADFWREVTRCACVFTSRQYREEGLVFL